MDKADRADDRITAGEVTEQRPVRVLISYAHDDQEHVDRVREFWVFLRTQGIDARLDLQAAEQRVDWAQWMTGRSVTLTGCW